MRRTVRDIAASALLVLVAALVYREALTLPEGLYDPLGAGTMPRIVAGGIVLLSMVSVARSLWRGRDASPAPVPRGAAGGEGVAEALPPLRPRLAIGVYFCTLAFAALLAFRAPYWACSAGFLLVATLAVARFRRPAVVPALLFSAVVAAVVTYLFTSVFRVDLP